MTTVSEPIGERNTAAAHAIGCAASQAFVSAHATAAASSASGDNPLSG
ncbi:hypothetical protein [Mycolicibacterium fortuitum]|nr:hypothetical protein [Mycolicibacterium fortuitum]